MRWLHLPSGSSIDFDAVVAVVRNDVKVARVVMAGGAVIDLKPEDGGAIQAHIARLPMENGGFE